MLKQVFSMTEEEKQKFIEVNGKIILYLVERRSLFDIILLKMYAFKSS